MVSDEFENDEPNDALSGLDIEADLGMRAHSRIVSRAVAVMSEGRFRPEAVLAVMTREGLDPLAADALYEDLCKIFRAVDAGDGYRRLRHFETSPLTGFEMLQAILEDPGADLRV
jgi:hypothetical protein